MRSWFNSAPRSALPSTQEMDSVHRHKANSLNHEEHEEHEGLINLSGLRALRVLRGCSFVFFVFFVVKKIHSEVAMSTNSETLFEAFLNQHDQESWSRAVTILLPHLHEV